MGCNSISPLRTLSQGTKMQWKWWKQKCEWLGVYWVARCGLEVVVRS